MAKLFQIQKEILTAEHDYFLDLYTYRTDSSDKCYIESLNSFIHQPNTPKHSDQQQEELEQIFTEKEILDSLKQLKNGWTPVTDDLNSSDRQHKLCIFERRTLH